MNDFTMQIPITKIKNNKAFQTKDIIIKEERVSFYLNGNKIISTMCLPNEQDYHIIGFLMNEGVLESIKNIKKLTISKDGLCVYLEAKINEENIANLYHEKTLTSGCCVGVSANFEGKIVERFISSHITFSIDYIQSIIQDFEKANELFTLTGCIHKASIISESTTLTSQDIGRHNALDKVIGKAMLEKINLQNAILIVSGRLSMEMITKCAMSEIPIVISRAATTALAIKSAQKLGITLIGFARNGNLNIYTHEGRILL